VILARHEQAAAHAADGFARATGKVGVCPSTSGPGATNLVTGIATAFMDSSPMVALTAQVNTTLLGQDAFQETDIIGITMPIVKHSFQVKEVGNLASALKQAFHIAQTGRPGPVVVDLPRDVLARPCECPRGAYDAVDMPEKDIDEPEQLERIAKALDQSERPVVILGGGVKLSHATGEIKALVEKARIPFVTTMMGIGSVSAGNGYDLGFIGTHGYELANRMVHQADFILAVGTRFSDRSTSIIEEFAPMATIAQIDIDPTSIGKNINVDLPYIGDIKETVTALLPMVSSKDRAEWYARIKKEKDNVCENNPDNGCGRAGQLIGSIQDIMPGDTIAVADVGLNQIWTVRTWRTHSARNLITSGGMGTMGFSLPAAVGAKVGMPERDVVVISGDGGFCMNIQELATISYYNIPIKIVVINNGHLGMIRQLQDLFYQSRFTSCELGNRVDLIAVARGFGIEGRRVAVDENPEEAIREMSRACGPYLLEVMVDPDHYVYPIIPPGRSNVEMIFGKGE
jgi:acetolactate synthase-1/2/3 large subunit